MTREIDPSRIDPALWRGLTQPRFSRRQMLRYAGAGAGSLGLAAFLAACGTKGVVSSSGSPGAKLPNAGVGTDSWWDKQSLHHKLVFDNWPAYIDVSHGTHPSIDEFTAKTGIKVDYREDNNDNNAFFATYLRPFLQGGDPTGLDAVVLTTSDPPLGFMIDLGWLIPLDHRKMTNFK